VAIFDIDFFKSVNDSYGHPAGDEVLREVARRLQSALPGTAFLGRLGGEEFAVLFTGPFGEAREASAAAALAVGAEPITLEGSLKIHVTVSGGLAPWRVSGRIREQSLADTYEEADAALYEAKSSGRQQLVVRGGPKAA
jgi:diguanylate cyclase